MTPTEVNQSTLMHMEFTVLHFCFVSGVNIMAMPGKTKGPSCKVCGDEASGFHYGVDSCEGCKVWQSYLKNYHDNKGIYIYISGRG